LEFGTDIKGMLDGENDLCIDVLEKCDLDGDGTLDFNEFIQAAVSQQEIVNKENITKIFKMIDTSNDSKISIKNLTMLFSEKG